MDNKYYISSSKITGLHHYANFQFPGSFASEQNRVEIVEKQNLSEIDIPKNAYSVKFTGNYVYFALVQNGDVIYVETEHYCQSGEMFFDAVAKSYVDIAAEHGIDSILAGNMKNNNMEYVVKTRFGQYMPFDMAKDRVVDKTTYALKSHGDKV